MVQVKQSLALVPLDRQFQVVHSIIRQHMAETPDHKVPRHSLSSLSCEIEKIGRLQERNFLRHGWDSACMSRPFALPHHVVIDLS